MYDKFFISVTSHALYPLCHKLSHLLGPPSSVTYFMDGPLVPWFGRTRLTLLTLIVYNYDSRFSDMILTNFLGPLVGPI